MLIFLSHLLTWPFTSGHHMATILHTSMRTCFLTIDTILQSVDMLYDVMVHQSQSGRHLLMQDRADLAISTS